MSIVTVPDDFSSEAGAIPVSRGARVDTSRGSYKSWEFKAFPDLEKRNAVDLANLLTTPSAKTRLHAQQEILRRGGSGKEVLAIVLDKEVAPRARVAALYTLKQLLGKKSHRTLLKLVGDHPRVAEHALRALADRKTELSDIPQAPFLQALKNQNPRIRSGCCRGPWSTGR